jgi:hypothetical protein
LRHLIQELSRILLFAKRHCEELYNQRLPKLQSKVSGRRVGRDLVMLHPLCSADKGQVSGGVFFILPLAHHFLTFFHETSHSLARFRASRYAEDLQTLIKPFHLSLGLHKMGLQ